MIESYQENNTDFSEEFIEKLFKAYEGHKPLKNAIDENNLEVISKYVNGINFYLPNPMRDRDSILITRKSVYGGPIIDGFCNKRFYDIFVEESANWENFMIEKEKKKKQTNVSCKIILTKSKVMIPLFEK